MVNFQLYSLYLKRHMVFDIAMPNGWRNFLMQSSSGLINIH